MSALTPGHFVFHPLTVPPTRLVSDFLLGSATAAGQVEGRGDDSERTRGDILKRPRAWD